MKVHPIFMWGMYNWFLTPALHVWKNKDGGGFALHFLRGRIGFYITGMVEK